MVLRQNAVSIEQLFHCVFQSFTSFELGNFDSRDLDLFRRILRVNTGAGLALRD